MTDMTTELDVPAGGVDDAGVDPTPLFTAVLVSTGIDPELLIPDPEEPAELDVMLLPPYPAYRSIAFPLRSQRPAEIPEQDTVALGAPA